MMNKVKRLQSVTDEQYGGRRNLQAQSAVLNKVMYYDITRQTRSKSAFMDDDAKACYNRIVTGLSAVDGRKWGMSYDEARYTTNLFYYPDVMSGKSPLFEGTGQYNFYVNIFRDLLSKR